jgi:hypothetical protein
LYDCSALFDRFETAIENITGFKKATDRMLDIVNDCMMRKSVTRFEETLETLSPRRHRHFYRDMVAWVKAKEILFSKLNLLYSKLEALSNLEEEEKRVWEELRVVRVPFKRSCDAVEFKAAAVYLASSRTGEGGPIRKGK